MIHCPSIKLLMLVKTIRISGYAHGELRDSSIFVDVARFIER